MNLLYFIAGALSVLLALYLSPSKKAEKKRPRGWTRVDQFKWHFDFDFTLLEEHGVDRVGFTMLEAARRTLERAEQFKQGKIEPGLYSIRFDMVAGFTKRPAEEAPAQNS